LLTWTPLHTEVSSCQSIVGVGYDLEESWVIDHSRWALSHTSAVVLKVIAGLKWKSRVSVRYWWVHLTLYAHYKYVWVHRVWYAESHIPDGIQGND